MRTALSGMSKRELRRMASQPTETGRSRGQGEHNHQSAFFSILRLNEREFPCLKYIFAVPNAARRGPRLAAMMKAEGLKAGVPDIFIPIGRHGHFGAWIENKFGDNKLSPSQKEYSEFLTTGNYAFKVCYTVDQQLEFLEWYLGVSLKRA